MLKNYILRIYRGHPGHQFWEDFPLEWTPSANVISSLMDIQRRPVNSAGVKVEPVVWEAGCLEEVCGSCSMLVNGQPRQACTALIETIFNKTGDSIIRLAPLTKFPLIRDLIVDRTRMFEDLQKIHGWLDVGETFSNHAPGPKIYPEKQKVMYHLSTCMTCGCCLEACPQINAKSSFIGPAAISQARLFNANPVGYTQRASRLQPIMENWGCGNNQNCVKVCPKNIPLTDSIASISRDMTIQAWNNLFSFPDRDKES